MPSPPDVLDSGPRRAAPPRRGRLLPAVTAVGLVVVLAIALRPALTPAPAPAPSPTSSVDPNAALLATLSAGPMTTSPPDGAGLTGRTLFALDSGEVISVRLGAGQPWSDWVAPGATLPTLTQAGLDGEKLVGIDGGRTVVLSGPRGSSVRLFGPASVLVGVVDGSAWVTNRLPPSVPNGTGLWRVTRLDVATGAELGYVTAPYGWTPRAVLTGQRVVVTSPGAVFAGDRIALLDPDGELVPITPAGTLLAASGRQVAWRGAGCSPQQCPVHLSTPMPTSNGGDERSVLPPGRDLAFGAPAALLGDGTVVLGLHRVGSLGTVNPTPVGLVAVAPGSSRAVPVPGSAPLRIGAGLVAVSSAVVYVVDGVGAATRAWSLGHDASWGVALPPPGSATLVGLTGG